LSHRNLVRRAQREPPRDAKHTIAPGSTGLAPPGDTIFRFQIPSDDEVAHFLAHQKTLDFSYSPTGFTNAPAPDDWEVDHNRICLGQGRAVFERGKAALRAWTMFDLGWVRLRPVGVPLLVGQQVCVMASSLGVIAVNACRIVQTFDEAGASGEAVHRFGFTYGTLPGHVERGEERFVVTWDPANDEVWYDILAYSQPRHPLARLGKPWVRRQQARFAQDSMAAMFSAVTDPH